jgi:hypothetical protein
MAAYTTIDDPQQYFQTALWTGNATARDITFAGTNDMQPDLVWIKERSAVEGHKLFDAARGATNLIQSSSAGPEQDQDTSLTAFNSDGFSLGIDTGEIVNDNGVATVAWCWKAGAGAGSSNTDGSINTTTTSVSTTAGFSVSTYSGTGSNATIGHGLGVVPEMLLFKRRNASSEVLVYHKGFASDPHTDYMVMHGTGAVVDDATAWQDTAPTSTVFSIGTYTDINASGGTMVCYAWAGKQGFSKFGSYEGNSSSDGAVVYTGFSPAFLMVKCVSNASTDWMVTDNKRSHNKDSAYNNWQLRMNATDAEENGTVGVDFLHNGFKWRDSANDANVTGRRYLYMAYAHAPMVNSNGVPCTATAATGGRG